jgi:hypothetical protein
MIRAFLAAFFLALSFGASAGPMDRDFDKLERSLRLTPEQKDQYDIAVASTKRALLAIAVSGMQVKERMERELNKDRPDLNMLYDFHDLIIQQNKPVFREAGEEWKKLHRMLDPDQVRIARRFIEDKLDLLLAPPLR